MQEAAAADEVSVVDKNEYNLKLQEINQYVDQGNYQEAARAADQIDWRRVRNVRTLCLISEVYEAVDRLEDSKELLVRAYRRSPVGKTVLYRLTEITIKLKQFDEAIEYYSEYVQAAPHDNNRYILKYKIYRGRGSSVDEQIDILREYLDQEFNEKYAYELAKRYQEADRIRECLAQCDDLVLWFQSGHYVLKALELKQRYAKLTPKQKVIYERELSREESGEEDIQDEQLLSAQTASEADSIMEDTAREIAEAVKASVIEQSEEEADTAVEDELTRSLEESSDGEEVRGSSRRLVEGDTVVLDTAALRKALVETDIKSEAKSGPAADFDITANELKAALMDLDGETDTAKPQEEDSTPVREAAAEKAADKTVMKETVSEKAVSEESVSEKAGSEAAALAKDAADEAVSADEVSADEVSADEVSAEEAAETEVPAEETAGESESAAENPVQEDASQQRPVRRIAYDQESLQSEVARSMRQIMSGVGMRDTVDPDEELIDEVIERSKKDQEAAIASRDTAPGLHMNSRLHMPARRGRAEAGRLSIDDVLLSMGEKGTAVREAVAKAGLPKKQQPAGVLSAVDEALLNMGVSPEKLSGSTERAHSSSDQVISDTMKEISMPQLQELLEEEPAEERAAEEKAEEEVLPVYRMNRRGEEPAEEAAAAAEEPVVREAVEAETVEEESIESIDQLETLSAEETVEEMSAAEVSVDDMAAEEKSAEEASAAEESVEAVSAAEESVEAVSAVEESVEEASAAEESAEEVSADEESVETESAEEAAEDHAVTDAEADAAAEEEWSDHDISEESEPEMEEEEFGEEYSAAVAEDDRRESDDTTSQQMSMEDIVNARTRRIPREEIEERLAAENTAAQGQEAAEENPPRRRKKRYLPRSVRSYFTGFTSVPDLEMQIDSAIRQALNKGSDRTSRTGNVLIFGAHGSGKTTLATALAKAIGTGQNREFVKMAKIYATELNRRDIAATVARIAGGILIIEEAGDMEDSIAEQLTTAMEFRTDGLIILMEDEERYLRSLMIRHPRLMMKFTSQIILPQYTTTDLLNFAENMANASECSLGEGGADALSAIADQAAESGTPLTLIDVQEMVDKAVKRSSKLSRRMFGGRGRYDDEGRVLLTAKDFR